MVCIAAPLAVELVSMVGGRPVGRTLIRRGVFGYWVCGGAHKQIRQDPPGADAPGGVFQLNTVLAASGAPWALRSVSVCLAMKPHIESKDLR